MESAPSASVSTAPADIGGYEVIRPLWADQTWLAAAPGGRAVVIKILDPDCVWKQKLHPNVRDRLGRVRELAHTGVANLYGVERDATLGLVYLVWEYVHGPTLDELAADPKFLPSDLLMVSRELVLNLETLHSRGIVHGGIKPSNVVIVGGHRPVLTHVSPLLWSEAEADVEALLDMLEGMTEARDEKDTALAALVRTAREKSLTLRQIAGRMGALIESRGVDESSAEHAELRLSRRIRLRAILGAMALVILGGAVFASLSAYAGRHTPSAPPPPAAPAAAMEQLPRAAPGQTLSTSRHMVPTRRN